MTEFYYFAHAHPFLAFVFVAMGLGFVYEMTKLVLDWLNE